MREVVLITKRSCHLCDVTREQLRSLAPRLQLTVRELDVADHPDLEERYRFSVPVVRANGLTLLSGRITEPELVRELTRAFGPEPTRGVPPNEEEFLRALECPICGGDLESRPRAVVCLRCGQEYPRRDGVLMLMAPVEKPSGLGIMDRVGRLIGFKLRPPGEDRR